MKKILLVCFILFLSLNSFGQNHLSFNGMEINGKIADFTVKLTLKDKKIHFIDILSEDCYFLQGTFAGNNDTRIYLYCTPKTKIIYGVQVVLKESKNINDNDYKGELYKWIELYTEKYGEPLANYLSDPNKDYIIFSNNIELGAIKMYLWENNVLCFYLDRKNKELFDKELEQIKKTDI